MASIKKHLSCIKTLPETLFRHNQPPIGIKLNKPQTSCATHTHNLLRHRKNGLPGHRIYIPSVPAL